MLLHSDAAIAPALWSTQATAALSVEADRLCEIIDRHADDLRQARSGSQCRFGGVAFKLHGVGRNTIYRVEHGAGWFLRLSRSRDQAFMMRERCGADSITGVLASRSDYCGAPVIRVSSERAYVLATAIPGKPLNHLLATRSWWPGSSGVARVEASFRTLGAQLGAVHANTNVALDTPEAHERPFGALKKRLERASMNDPMVRRIATWAREKDRSDAGGTFVHGNLRLDNVLAHERQLGLIDFEHSGSGSRYQDVSRPTSQLLLTQATRVFPDRLASRYLNAFLSAYGRYQPLDAEQLRDYVACRFAHYYLANTGAIWMGRTAGLPIFRSAVRRMTCALFDEGLAGIDPAVVIRS